ncbi:MAG: hypothetical protein WCD02_09770, partial [Terriglobales bacterium]
MTSSPRVQPARYLGAINLRFALTLTIAVSTLLGGSVSSLAQQAASTNANPIPSPQSAPAPVPSSPSQAPSQTPAQTPTPPTNPTQTPAQATTKPRKLNCQHPANPIKRRFGCKDEDFDWKETLTADWNGARAEIRKLGITPSGSYFSALQTNASGGSHQMWGYVGDLTTAVDVNFEKLLKIPG